MPLRAFVSAQAVHLAAMETFIFDHGANAWNWLPVDGIREHLQEVVSGQAQGLLAFDGETLVGMMTYCQTHDYVRYQSAALTGTVHGYVSEAAVHRDYAGKGLGTRLLMAAVEDLHVRGMREVYISRHEENLASAGMMRKCGFVEIDTYLDPRRHNTGSGRTTVCRLRFDAHV
jgi:ribosomal protein S18 acetylase RimI-like enzyme